jgi:hypothetical protein
MVVYLEPDEYTSAYWFDDRQNLHRDSFVHATLIQFEG